MTQIAVTVVQSRDNPLLKELRRLAQENDAYRKQGRVWLEGDHLCRALLARGQQPSIAVFCESFWPQAPREWVDVAPKNIVMPDALFASISGLESPARMGFVAALPQRPTVQAGVASLVLDRVQDAGNAGSMLRSAGAFGFSQVIALKGTVALWGPKVLRAGMGAHFGLRLVEGVQADELDALQVPLIVTSSHQGSYLHQQKLPFPCAWAMGHEGQGVGAELQARATLAVRIAQPGGEESLNVAAAAAICLHASATSA